MNDIQLIWIIMMVISLVIGFLVLFAKVDEASIQRTSRFNPMGGLFRYGWWKYAVAATLFCLSILSFALLKGCVT